jgi:hypothetical protein
MQDVSKTNLELAGCLDSEVCCFPLYLQIHGGIHNILPDPYIFTIDTLSPISAIGTESLNNPRINYQSVMRRRGLCGP